MHPLFCEEKGPNFIRYIGHRGFTPLAPENSLPSFAYAGRLGQWAIETDVRLTRDGVAVCNHDADIQRTYNGAGAIREMTMRELSKYRIATGSRQACFSDEEMRMPLFSEYLTICRRSGCVPFFELKTEDVDPILWQMRKAGFADGEVIASSVHFSILKAVRHAAPEMFIHWIFASEAHIDDLAACENAGLSLNEMDLSLPWLPEKVRALHEKGLKVCLRAADSAEAVRRMMDMKLDYLPTNCMHPRL